MLLALVTSSSAPASTDANKTRSASFRLSRTAVAVVASPIPVLMALTVVVFRAGYPTPDTALLRMAGISLLVVSLMSFGKSPRWYLCGPALAILALLALTILGFSPLGGKTAGTIFAIAGFLLWLRNLLVSIKESGAISTLMFVVLGLFLGLYLQGTYWQTDTQHDLLYPEAMAVGQVRADIMQQAAIVQMIEAHRLASTGIDGMVPIKNHNGAFWMAAALQKLSGFSPLEFMAFGYGILLLPLYAAAFCGCAELIRYALQDTQPGLPASFWGICLASMIGLFPYTADPMNLNFRAVIISDSFCLGTILALLLIGVTASMYSNYQATDSMPGKFQKALLMTVLPVSLGLIGFVKISVMAILLALAVYIAWRMYSRLPRAFLAGVLLSICVFAYLMYEQTGATRARFAPLRFDRIAPEWVPYFFVAYLIWPWLFLITWMRRRKVHTVGDLAKAIRSRDSISVEMVFICAAFAILPYLLLDFYFPVWKFFTEFQAIFAGVFIASFSPWFRSGRDWLYGIRSRDIPVTSLLLLGVVVAIAGHLFMATTASTYRMVRQNGEIRAIIAGKTRTAWRTELPQLRNRKADISSDVASHLNTLACLRDIAQEPINRRKVTALYIPKTNRAYWDLRQLNEAATPFIAPALSGVMMVDGLPEYEDIGLAAIGWGYPQYRLPTKPELPAEDVQHAIGKARSNGFRRLLVFRDSAREGCQFEEKQLD